MAGIVPIGRLAFLLALPVLALLAAGPLAAQQTRSVTVEPRPSPAAQLKLGDAYALVIGNNQYKHLPVLQTAVSDAAAVAELLRGRYEFADVRLLLNATRADILRALGRYRRDLEPQDRLLIYYAGHGLLDREAERGYWLPVDAEQDFNAAWISNATITDALKAMLARHVMVVADSCYSGTLTRGKEDEGQAPAGTDPMAWMTRVAAKRARTALVSGGLEPVVDGGRNGHSVFATAFLDVLRENNGLLDGQGLFDRLKGQVVVNADQTPDYGNVRNAFHEGGDFIFVPRGALAALPSQPVPVVPTRPAPLTGASPCMVTWHAIATSRSPPELEAFLKAYPDCPVAPIVRARLDTIQAETTPDAPEFAVEERDETLMVLKNANVRAAPATSGKKLTTLRQDMTVAVTGKVTDRDWLQVMLEDGRTGYIWAQLLGSSRPEPRPTPKPDKDAALWAKAVAAGTANAFRAYKEECETCRFSEDADRRLTALARAEENAAREREARRQACVSSCEELHGPVCTDAADKFSECIDKRVSLFERCFAVAERRWDRCGDSASCERRFDRDTATCERDTDDLCQGLKKNVDERCSHVRACKAAC